MRRELSRWLERALGECMWGLVWEQLLVLGPLGRRVGRLMSMLASVLEWGGECCGREGLVGCGRWRRRWCWAGGTGR